MTDSKHLQILNAVANAVRALNLPGIGDRVHVMMIARDTAPECPELPAVIVSAFGRETLTRPTTATDDVGYPAFVVIVEAADTEQGETATDRRLLWRERLFGRFSRSRVQFGQSAEANTAIEPNEIVDVGAWFERNVYAGGFTVRCTHRQVRSVW